MLMTHTGGTQLLKHYSLPPQKRQTHQQKRQQRLGQTQSNAPTEINSRNLLLQPTDGGANCRERERRTTGGLVYSMSTYVRWLPLSLPLSLSYACSTGDQRWTSSAEYADVRYFVGGRVVVGRQN